MNAPATQGRHPLPSPSGRRCHAAGVTDEGATRNVARLSVETGCDRVSTAIDASGCSLHPSGFARHLLPEGEGGAPLRKALTGDARAATTAGECLT
jgi:hypothetical protein